MAAARPVVAAVDEDCDTGELIRRARCGLVVPPGNGEALAQAILHYHQHPADREFAGKEGREYFLNNLEKKGVLHKYLNLIENLIK